MEFIMTIVIGILFMAATYLILSRSILKIILGTGLLSHGAHLLILTMGGLGGTSPPVLGRRRNRLCRSFAASAYFDGDCYQFRCDSIHPRLSLPDIC